MREADKATEEAHRCYQDAIAELEQARTELAENRQAALWARLFPDSLAKQRAQRDGARDRTAEAR